MKTPYTLVAGGLFASGIAAAGPLGAEPSLGVASDYSTNPELRATGQRAESHAALLLSVPVRYNLDNLEYSLTADARYSDASGYSSLASNYFHVDAGARDVGEAGWVSMHAGFNRDTSLYHSGESELGVGVRRDTRTALAQLEHSLTERFSLELDADWTRTTYDQRALSTSLVDYRYISATPSLKFALSERNSVSLTGTIGRYNSLDQITASRSRDVQAGFERQIDEAWTLSMSAGYSRSQNTLKYFFGPFYLGDIASSQKGTVYDMSLRRRGEKFSFAGKASRALRPTGFAFLSRQESVEILMQYEWSERLSVAASGRWDQVTDPRTARLATTRSNLGGDVSVNWKWTMDWLVSLRASRLEQRYQGFAADADSTGVNLEITRQFHRVEF